MKNRVVGEAESNLTRLDNYESKASFLESVRLKNEIEIENLKADCEDLEIKARIADEKARNAYDEVSLGCSRIQLFTFCKNRFDRCECALPIMFQGSY